MSSELRTDKRDAPPSVLLTSSDLAEMFGETEQTQAVRRVRGDGPKFIRIGRQVRYRLSDVEAWLDAQTRTSTSARGDSRRSA